MTNYETIFHLTLEDYKDHEVYYLLDDGRTFKSEALLTDDDNVKIFHTSRECALTWAYLYDGLLVRWPTGKHTMPTIEIVMNDISIATVAITDGGII